MTTITIDDAGSMPLGEVLRQATDDTIEIRTPAGELLATVFLESRPPEATEEEYAELVARAEADIDELRRIANTPREKCVTVDEHLAKLKALRGQ